MRLSTMLSAAAFVAVLGAAGTTSAQSAGGANAAYNSCYQQAIAKGLSGDARRVEIDNCLSTPAAQAATPMGRSYGECRAGAIARGLSGDDLRLYLNSCVTG